MKTIICSAIFCICFAVTGFSQSGAYFTSGTEGIFSFGNIEKTYEDGDKVNKITGWFRSRQNVWQSSLMVGVQFPYGART